MSKLLKITGKAAAAFGLIAITAGPVVAQEPSRPNSAISYDCRAQDIVSFRELSGDPRIQTILDEAKGASKLEKIAKYGAGIFNLALAPGLGLYIAGHESAHLVASVSLGQGSESINILPVVYSDKAMKLRLVKEYGWCSADEAAGDLGQADFSKVARVFNYASAPLSGLGVFTSASFSPKTPWQDIPPIKRAGLLLSPYAIDIAVLALAREQIGNAKLDNGKPTFFEYSAAGITSTYALGVRYAALTSGITGIIGIGDFAKVAETILPPKQFSRWYHTVARSALAGAMGIGISYAESKIIDNGFQRAVNNRNSR